MKAYLHLKTFDGRCAFSTWLTRIAINSALMTLRRRRSRPEACMEVMDQGIWRPRDVIDQGKNAEQHCLKQENVERLRRAIRGLKPSLRTVVEIHQSNDGQVKEIAEIAGISISATKSRLLRARINLRRRLEYQSPAA
jgi:RNA polymerase sigma-70 factor (ECF subfamily)